MFMLLMKSYFEEYYLYLPRGSMKGLPAPRGQLACGPPFWSAVVRLQIQNQRLSDNTLQCIALNCPDYFIYEMISKLKAAQKPFKNSRIECFNIAYNE